MLVCFILDILHCVTADSAMLWTIHSMSSIPLEGDQSSKSIHGLASSVVWLRKARTSDRRSSVLRPPDTSTCLCQRTDIVAMEVPVLSRY